MSSSLSPPAATLPLPSSPRSSTSSASSHTHDYEPPHLQPAQMAPIEARSLAPIFKLAANPPPQLPDFEAAAQRNSLLLWIVRVPESNDLILTPLHPPKSTATASDITASLYYLHYTSPTSATLIRRDAPNNIQESVAEISGLLSNAATITLSTPGYQRLTVPAHERPPPPPQHQQSPSGVRGMPIRKPVPGQQPPPPTGPPEEPFTRVLTLESASDSHHRHKRHHSIPGISKLKHMRNKSSSNQLHQTPLPSPSPSPSFQTPQQSVSSASSYFSTYSSSLSPSPHPPSTPQPQHPNYSNTPSPGVAPQKRKKSGYLFASPWRNSISTSPTIPPDVCEFQSEALGRYLKLKYYTPTQKQSRALLSVVEVTKDPGRPHDDSSSGGWDEADGYDASGRWVGFGGASGGYGKKSPFSSSSPSSSSSSRTKAERKGVLGMLIVHGVGFEMLDLVVAANFVALMKRWDKWGRERRAVGF